ncbi:MAG: LpqB family beta-propeller domain-containing protein [Thermocrispum sp.]
MRRRGLSVIAAALLVGVAGCANVPLETEPQSIRPDAAVDNGSAEGAPPPAKDLPAADVVRAFVETSAQKADSYSASRQYLSPAAAKSWQPTDEVQILDDDFNTIPAPRDEQPDNDNETVITLVGEVVGQLHPDNSFTPLDKTLEKKLRLRRQPGTGEWRIIGLPDSVVTNESEFGSYYFTTRLYFYAPNSNVLVPDLRYIAAQPAEGLASRTIHALTEGPSYALRGAVDDPLSAASVETNVREVGSALEVPLTGLVGSSEETRKQIVTQVVMSLENVELVRLLSEGKPLLPDRTDWRRGDLRAVAPEVADSDGYAVLNGKLVSLASGSNVLGPAGSGAYQVVSAAQSLEGGQLALVEDEGKTVRLRVGELGKDAAPVSIRGKRMTRPTWQPAYPGNKVSSEVWTVVDGRKVVRAQLTQDGAWVPRAVGTAAVRGFGAISALRLSRDGTRAAMVADGKLVVAAVVRTPDSVELRTPRILQPAMLADVKGVDWTSQQELVVATESSSQPVVQVSVDGFTTAAYSSSNLQQPITGITALPSGRVLAADANGLWTVSSTNEPWDSQRNSQQGMTSPLYPG